MTDSVPSWHDQTGGQDTGTTGWSPQGPREGPPRPQAPARGAAGQGTNIDQLAQRLFDELGRTQTALEQVHAEAQAARADAQAARADVEAARAEARDAHDAAEILLEQVTAWEDAGSGAETHDAAPAAPVPHEHDDEPLPSPAAPSPAPQPTADGPRPGSEDPLAGALAAFAAELQTAADARARGEIDARQALRLARSGFHQAHRVIARVGREELRANR